MGEVLHRGESMTRLQLQPADRPFEPFLRHLHPRILGVLSSFQIPREDAEDLLQETLVALIFKWESIRNPESWLLSTLRNRCLIYLRQKDEAVYETVDTAILDVLAGPQSPPQVRADLRHDLNVALSKLPRRCRDLLRLRYGLGQKSSEIAEELGYESEGMRKLTTKSLVLLSRELKAAGLGREDFL